MAKKHGRGTLHYANGVICDGEWTNDRMTSVVSEMMIFGDPEEDSQGPSSTGTSEAEPARERHELEE